ncbi:cadherin-like protein [Vibrio phage 1.063.O._10N.261.45.C7]|nr:cadherin-like protein [Vibrio phage 1.063.O._10N.261.45.C7]
MIKVYADSNANIIVIEDGLIGHRAINTLQAVVVEDNTQVIDIINKTLEDGSGGRVKELHQILLTDFVDKDENPYGTTQQEVVDTLNSLFSMSGSSGGSGGTVNADFKPSIQNQTVETIEDANISYQMVLQGNNKATIYGSSDLPSWLVLDQKSGMLMGSSPPYAGVMGSGIYDVYPFTVTCASPFGSSSGLVEIHVAESTNDMFLSHAFDMQYVDYLYSTDNLSTNYPFNKNTTLEGWSVEVIVKLDSSTTGLYTLGASSGTSSWGACGLHAVNNSLKLMLDYEIIDAGITLNTSDWWSIIVTCDATTNDTIDFEDHIRLHVRNLTQGVTTHKNISTNESGKAYSANRRASFGLSNYWGDYKLGRASLWRGVLNDSDCDAIFNHNTNSPNIYTPSSATFWGGWSASNGTVFPKVEEYNNILDGGNPSPTNRLTMKNMTSLNIYTVTIPSN